MRYLIFFFLLATALAEASDFPELVHPTGAELVKEQVDATKAAYQVVLGALEKINRQLEPEASETVIATRAARTYYLPQSRRTAKVLAHYQPQLEALGELLYQCSGRTCGSSSYWANRIFDEAILYGPEQYQHYLVLQIGDSADYLAVYIGQRATRKIYVHITHFRLT